jgi:hypothetical protein
MTMKVFGIGLEKTGTTTLGRALEILGYQRHKGFDLDLLQQVKGGNVSKALEVAEDYDNFENYPWPLIYEDLFARFPESKFILTIRTTPLRWFNSMSHHARRTGPSEERQLIYGHSMPNLFEREDIAFYENHVKNVKKFFDSHDATRLLTACWAHEEGWEPICKFLDKPVPEQEFPHLNR